MKTTFTYLFMKGNQGKKKRQKLCTQCVLNLAASIGLECHRKIKNHKKRVTYATLDVFTTE